MSEYNVWIVAEHGLTTTVDAEIAQLIKDETNWATYNGRSYGNIRPAVRVLVHDRQGLVAHVAVLPLTLTLDGLGALVVAERARRRGLGPLMVTTGFEVALRRPAERILTSTRVRVLRDHLLSLGFHHVPTGVITWQEDGVTTTKDRFFAWARDGSTFPQTTLQTGRF